MFDYREPAPILSNQIFEELTPIKCFRNGQGKGISVGNLRMRAGAGLFGVLRNWGEVRRQAAQKIPNPRFPKEKESTAEMIKMRILNKTLFGE